MVHARAARHADGMTTDTNHSRQLTRSTSDKKLSGVAGGLAAYFSVDPVLIRIAFAVTTLFSGAGLVAYLALALFVPNDAGDPAPLGGRPIAV
jgi:phage shock protein C